MPLVFPAKFSRSRCFRPGDGPEPGSDPAPSQGGVGSGRLDNPGAELFNGRPPTEAGVPDDNAPLAEE